MPNHPTQRSVSVNALAFGVACMAWLGACGDAEGPPQLRDQKEDAAQAERPSRSEQTIPLAVKQLLGEGGGPQSTPADLEAQLDVEKRAIQRHELALARIDEELGAADKSERDRLMQKKALAERAAAVPRQRLSELEDQIEVQGGRDAGRRP